jgi:hypothetical protein
MNSDDLLVEMRGDCGSRRSIADNRIVSHRSPAGYREIHGTPVPRVPSGIAFREFHDTELRPFALSLA